MKAKDLMTERLLTLHPKDKLIRAKEIFNKYPIHHILIEVMGELRGIISQGDLLFLEGMVTSGFDEFLRIKKYQEAAVEEIMTPNPISVEADVELSSILDIMIRNRINAVPITDSGKLVGLITAYDLITFMRSNYEVIFSPDHNHHG